jgi:hypothetical protein
MVPVQKMDFMKTLIIAVALCGSCSLVFADEARQSTSEIKIQPHGKASNDASSSVAAANREERADPSENGRAGHGITPPPPGVLWATAIVALLNVVWSILSFYLKRSDDIRERQRAMLDDFWFRTIIAPSFIEPLREFAEKFTKELGVLDSMGFGNERDKREQYDTFVDGFDSERTSLLHRSLILRLVGQDLYNEVTKKIDELEDIVVHHCAARVLEPGIVTEKYMRKTSAEGAFFECYELIVRAIREFHWNQGNQVGKSC